ncbi:MAG: T9SS type A sorting domain-containing protein [Bacteroidota bacterium]
MKHLYTLFLLAGGLCTAWGQHLVSPSQRGIIHEYIAQDYLDGANFLNRSNGHTTSSSGASIGSHSVNSLKIGESSNAYSYLSQSTNQLYAIPGLGNGGAISLVYRQNINRCGGMVGDNGRLRLSFSADGGQNWDVGAATVPTTPPFTGCWGIGLVNPNYTRASRYPNGILYQLSGSTELDSLSMVYVAPVLQTSGSGWDGNVRGMVRGLNTGNIISMQEEYVQQNGDHYQAYSLTHQPGTDNFWYLSREFVNGEPTDVIILNKGTYNSAKRQIDWTEYRRFTLNLDVSFDGNSRLVSTHIAFSPDGQTGYIGCLGDITNGQDSVYAPIFIESTDAGTTWGTPYEFDMRKFQQLRDELLGAVALDSVFDGQGNFLTLDTVSVLTGIATCAFTCDLEVDKNGYPHLLALVGGASTVTDPRPGYTISGALYLLYDFTKDQFGDWNMMKVADQGTLRGWFGDLGSSDDAEYFSVDCYPTVSRSADGELIFYQWTDTDTTGNFTPLPSIPGQPDQWNHSPNLLGRAYDLAVDKLTPIQNWTITDSTWTGRVLIPRASDLVLENGDDYVVPMTIMEMDGTSALQNVSYWYFSDIGYDRIQDFTLSARFFHNCKSAPFANTSSATPADCNTNTNGAAAVSASGGVGSYTYQWQTGATTSSISGLSAGVYEVVVTDSLGCSDSLAIAVNQAGAPALTLSGLKDPLCATSNDGEANVTLTGGTAPFTYSWQCSGETTQAATNLSGGRCVLEVTDANGCKSFAPFKLNAPSPLQAQLAATAVNCFGDQNGTVNVLATTGGTPPFAYQWNDPSNSTGQTINNLVGGWYQLTVTDDNGCVLLDSVQVAEPAVLTASTSSTDVTDLTFCDGTLTTSVAGGTAPYSVELFDASGQPVGNGTFVFGLCPGVYEVCVTDDNGCETCAQQEVLLLTSLEGSLPGLEAFSLAPNPAVDEVILNIRMGSPEQINLHLLDAMGREVQAPKQTFSSSWTQKISTDNLSNGIYFIRLSTSRGSLTRKLLVKH